MTKKWKLGGLAAVAAAVAAGAIGFALVTHSGSASADTPGGNATRLQEILAQKLGVSVQALQDAEKGAVSQLADELLAQGKITQAQADKIKSADIGGILHDFDRLGGPHGRGPGRGLDVSGVVTGLLHIDSATLKAELQSGKSLTAIAGEHGVSRDALKSALLSAEKARLDAAVKAGSLTQAQADQMAATLSSRIDALIDRAGGMGPMGFGHGRHGAPPATPTP